MEERQHQHPHPRTNLIVISGSPGSGKTTLARRLGERMSYPVIARDALKEVLMDALPPANRQESMRLGVASWPMMYAVLAALIDRSPGVIVESNFRRGRSEPELVPHLDRCRAVVIHCTAEWGTIAARIEARDHDPDRHPGHFDQVALAEVRRDYEGGQFAPLELAAPTVTVDTGDGYSPPLDAIQELIERRWREGLS